MIKKIKRIIKRSTFKKLYIISAVVLCVLALSIFFYSKAPTWGLEQGSIKGSSAGRAKGSFEGLVAAVRDSGSETGEEGAVITQSEDRLARMIADIGKINVLVSDGTYIEKFGIGENYKALLSMDYSAVMTIDTSTADISFNDAGIIILLDKPEVEFDYLSDVDIVAEYKKAGFMLQGGSLDAFYNTKDSMPSKVHDKALKNESLLKDARSAAQLQIDSIISAALPSAPNISVDYKIGGYDDELF